MQRSSLATLLLILACDPAQNAESEPTSDETEAPAPKVSETETVVDRASLSALCIRSTLSLPLGGTMGTGVLIDKKDGTQRYGWVAGELEPSAFDKLDAEQAARMLEVHLKAADSLRSQFVGACTTSIAKAKPVLVTFTLEHEPTGEESKPGYWIVAGDAKKRSIEFMPNATAAEARAKALSFALEQSGATALAIGNTVDKGEGTQPLCPQDWCESVE